MPNTDGQLLLQAPGRTPDSLNVCRRAAVGQGEHPGEMGTSTYNFGDLNETECRIVEQYELRSQLSRRLADERPNVGHTPKETRRMKDARRAAKTESSGSSQSVELGDKTGKNIRRNQKGSGNEGGDSDSEGERRSQEAGDHTSLRDEQKWNNIRRLIERRALWNKIKQLKRSGPTRLSSQ
ncbi:hypothetical protein BDV18DRAFT_134486 [Aspergillus unguis]